MKLKIFTGCLLLTFFLVGCKKWIDVKPGDRLTEEELFGTTQGYLSALNGVYVELAHRDSYGERMSVAHLDVMAQYYTMNPSTHQFFQYATFNYTADTPKVVFDNIWKKAYELIVNCNVIIDRCGDNNGNGVLSPTYNGIVKGEALALRAMLHLDMLRLFGPIYTQADKDKPCIPYSTAPRPQTTPLLGSAEVMQNILKDLNAAADLLKGVDPVITEGVRHTPGANGTNDFQYRQYRLNYYAVKALQMRAYMWMQDKPNALVQAQQILSETLNPTKPIFPMVITKPTDTARATSIDFDNMFRSEVMFGMYKLNRHTIFNAYFTPDLPSAGRLSFNDFNENQDRLNALYDDGNDYRRNAWVLLRNPLGTYLTHLKYAVTIYNASPNMMPLIRLSEVILTAAECSNTLSEGTAYLNTVRLARNCVNLNPTSTTQLKDFITNEFRKEVIGEGQMFFYYKRNAMTTIPNHVWTPAGPNKIITLTNYVVPLPISEVSVRGN